MQPKFVLRMIAFLITIGFSVVSINGLWPTSRAMAQTACPSVQNTPAFTIVYGAITVGGQPIPIGAVVEARNPRGDVVGCFVVNSAGKYGAMFVYGEDNTVTPAIPGMQAGETMTFYVNGSQAIANPTLVWANDLGFHEVNLEASAISVNNAWTVDALSNSAPTRTQFVPGETVRIKLEVQNQTTQVISTVWNIWVTRPDGGRDNVEVNAPFDVLLGLRYIYSYPYTASTQLGTYTFTAKFTWDNGQQQIERAVGFEVVTFPCSEVTEIPQLECEALISLYTSTNGDNWLNNSGWLKTKTPCSWQGVTCDNGQVTGINIYGNQLTGNIPNNLGNLSQLRNLDLTNNQLTGAIPTTLGQLAKLEHLKLFGNQLSGSIPIELGNLSNLVELALERNQLSGYLPPELGNLSKLEALTIWNNQLSGSLPLSLTQLKLITFNFGPNDLCEPGETSFQTWLQSIKNLSRTFVTCITPTPMATPTATIIIPTSTPTTIPSATPSNTPTTIPLPTATLPPTPSRTPLPTSTSTAISTATPTSTSTPTRTSTATQTPAPIFSLNIYLPILVKDKN